MLVLLHRYYVQHNFNIIKENAGLSFDGQSRIVF